MVRSQTRAQKRNRRQQNKTRRNNQRQNKTLRRKRQSRRKRQIRKKLRGGEQWIKTNEGVWQIKRYGNFFSKEERAIHRVLNKIMSNDELKNNMLDVYSKFLDIHRATGRQHMNPSGHNIYYFITDVIDADKGTYDKPLVDVATKVNDNYFDKSKRGVIFHDLVLGDGLYDPISDVKPILYQAYDALIEIQSYNKRRRNTDEESPSKRGRP